jgi:hypothetical protein
VNGVTLDAGALVALERNDREMCSPLKRLVMDGTSPTVPTVVLAHVWRDGARQANLARALKHSQLEPLTEDLAREAAAGRKGLTRGPSPRQNISTDNG